MKIIGHRGAKGIKAENTLPSIKTALDLGVDEIEIDVRVTKDGIAVLMHDAQLIRLTGIPAPVADFSYDNLKAVKPDLATLAEAIKLVNQQKPLLIEVKPEVDTASVAAVLYTYLKQGWQPQHFLLASFSYGVIKTLHEALPDIPTVINDRWSGVRASSRARRLGTKRISMNQRWLWGGFIKAVAHSGYQLCAYPLNDPTKASRWEKAGLYGIITDNPDRFNKK